MHRKPRADRALALECSTNAATAPFKEREFRHGLLLLAFFAEDKLTAIFDALALVRLRLAPATALSSDLPDLLLVIAGALDRRVIRGLDLVPFGARKVDIMAVAKLQLQLTTLSIRTRSEQYTSALQSLMRLS